MRDLAKSLAQKFIYLIFISSVTIKVRVRVRFNNYHMSRKSLVLRVIWHCDIFGMQGRRSLWDRGDMSLPIFMKGDIHGNVPPIF